MPGRNRAERRVILAVDIRDYSRPDWTDEDRRRARQRLHRCLHQALRGAGLHRQRYSFSDTGDGVICFVNTPETSRVVDAVETLRSALRSTNRPLISLFRLQLRVAVHAGDVVPDAGTFVGHTVDETRRLLDSEELRARLRARPSDLVLIVSDHVYDTVIAQRLGGRYDPEDFEPVTAHVKDKDWSAPAWLLRPVTPPEPIWNRTLRAARRWLPMVLRQAAAVLRPRIRIGPFGKVPGWNVPVWLVAATTLILLGAGVAPAVGGRADPCPSPTPLPILADPEMVAPLREIADTLLNPEGACRRADLHVYAADSPEEAVAAVAADWPTPSLKEVDAEPAVWVPGSTLEVQQAVQRPNSPRLDVRGSIARSAVVVAMVADDTANLGLDRTATWTELLDHARGQDGAAPTLRLTRANPASSGAALLGTMAMYQAAERTGQPGARHDLEQAVEPATGGEVATLCALGAAPAAAGQPHQAVVTTEQAMRSRNRHRLELCGLAHRNAPDLEAIYPADGTFVKDYPYVLLPYAVEYPARKALAEELYTRLRAPAGQQALRKAGFRQVNGITDQRDGVLANQPQTVLPLPAAQAATDTVEQWRTARRPVTALLALDVSGSMKDPAEGERTDRMTVARQGVQDIVGAIGARDHIGLWVFSTRINGPRDYRAVVPLPRPGEQADAGARRDQILAHLRRVGATGGDTGLYDTIVAGIRDLRAASPAGTSGDQPLNTLIVITDGLNDDPAGGAQVPDVLAEHRKDDPPTYVAVLTFGTAACASHDLRLLDDQPAIDCIDAGDIGMRRATERITTTLWGAEPPP